MSTTPRLREVFTRLVRVQTDLWNAVDARVRADHGVPLTHVTALQVIVSTPDCRVQDLVSTLHITVGGASKVADRLVAAGHVIRMANPDDRRSSVLIPTDAGRQLLVSSNPSIDSVLDARVGSRLGAEELTALDQLLRTLQDVVPSDSTLQTGA